MRLTIFLTLITSTVSLFGNYGKDLYWPTANAAFIEGGKPEAYLQATASGRIESGDWGCSRNGGKRYHEGIDLKSIERSKNGIAEDKVYSVAAGVVAHICRTSGDSNYGKYVVVNHVGKGVEWYSLYAHLRDVGSNLRVGSKVKAAQVLGVMGHTSSSIPIPESRSHLHFEVGVRNNTYFENWYQQQSYTTPNKHGSWNGMNLIGTNPIEFFNYFLDHPNESFSSYFLQLPIAFELLLYFEKTPDFLFRNPGFLKNSKKINSPGWYRVGFTWYGLPASWEFVSANKVDKRMNHVAIHIQDFKHERSCRNWIDDTSKGLMPTELLTRHIELLRTKP